MAYCEIVGEICGPFRKTVDVFEWNIPEFYSKTLRNPTFFGPAIFFMGTSFHFSVESSGMRFGLKTQISLNLKSPPNTWLCPTDTVHFTLRMKIANYTENVVCDGTIRKQTSCFGNDFLLSDLLARNLTLNPSATLTITCTFWIDVVPSLVIPSASRETQTEDLPNNGVGEKGGALLRKHFKNLLLDGQARDVTLIVKDKEFKAHKDILRARSSVFAAMFAHNMKEAECGDVTIEDCDSDAFSKFLEYVYTGMVDGLTPSNALGLYYVADKYDFPDLKEMCVEFLKTSLSTNLVCDVIDMAMKHGEEELRDCAMAFFTDHLMEILMTVEWQRFFKSNATLANELNIKAMKSYKKVD